MSDYYELLQVARDADDDTIKKSYRRLARLYHPDSNSSHFAAEHMKLLNAAYDVLSDPLKRRQYDERLAEAARRAMQPRWAAQRSAPQGAIHPWLIWAGVTALLIVIAFAGTLYVLRSQLPNVNLVALQAPTRAPLLLPPPTRTLIATEEPSPTDLPTLTPTPSPTSTRPPNTPTSTPHPPTSTSTPLPPTRTPTAVPYPLPAVATDTRIVTLEFPNGPNGGGDIFVSNLDGSFKINLTHSGELSEGAPSWSPFAQHIVFSDSNNGSLFVMTANGSLTTRLTSDPLVRDSNPEWAPVGSLIAYESIQRDALAAGDLQAARVFLIDFGSRLRRQIGNQPGQDLTWSPDGKWLAYDVPAGGGTTIYVANLDRPPQQYYFTAPRIRRMAWTADSRELAYEAFVRDTNGDGHIDDQDNPDVYVITLQPVNVQRLSGTLVVVSPRGKFPGPSINGEYYPPISSLVRQ